MKKLLIIPLLALSLGACAQLKNFDTAWQVLTSASVSPTQIIIAGNAFDALEATATQYLNYCKSVAASPPQACALGNRKPVVAAVRAGIKARNALEPYVTSNTAGPSALYNALVAAIQSLQGSTMPTGK